MATDRDPVATNPDLYRVVFENERVRVLAYRDAPGAKTAPHGHPDSVMITMSAFRRRLVSGEESREVTLQPWQVRWLPAQTHSGENVGDTPSEAFFVELKDAAAAPQQPDAELALGPRD